MNDLARANPVIQHQAAMTVGCVAAARVCLALVQHLIKPEQSSFAVLAR